MFNAAITTKNNILILELMINYLFERAVAETTTSKLMFKIEGELWKSMNALNMFSLQCLGTPKSEGFVNQSQIC